MAKGKHEQWITEEGLLKIGGWAKDGLTDEQIAHNMGVSRITLYNWKNKFVDIFNTLKDSKEVVDREVENALLKRALGYRYTEMTYEPQYDKESDSFVLKVSKQVIKEIVPDTTAQIFWLKNRKPAEWRDKRELNVDAIVKNKYEGMSDEELGELIGKYEKVIEE